MSKQTYALLFLLVLVLVLVVFVFVFVCYSLRFCLLTRFCYFYLCLCLSVLFPHPFPSFFFLTCVLFSGNGRHVLISVKTDMRKRHVVQGDDPLSPTPAQKGVLTPVVKHVAERHGVGSQRHRCVGTPDPTWFPPRPAPYRQCSRVTPPAAL